MNQAPSIQQQVRSSAEQVARRAMKLYRWRAALWALGLGLVATLGFVGLDYALHVEESGLRWLLSLLWIATLTGIGLRYLPDAYGFELSAVRVAQWIERRQPELRGRLSNLLAATDLPANDARFGSAEFKKAALQSADPMLASLPWQSFVDTRPTLRAAGFFVVALITGFALLVSTSEVSLQGIKRIALPWSVSPWPRADDLELVNVPEIVATGQELEVLVVDLRPPLPDRVELQVKEVGAADSQAQHLPMRLLEKAAVITLPSLDADVAIRPWGGDCVDAPWQTIRVTRLPELKEHSFRVQPPVYSQQAPTELVGWRIEVLSGSQVTFRGSYDIPLRSLRARRMTVDSRDPASTVRNNADSPQSSQAETNSATNPAADTSTTSSTESWPAVLDSDQRSFSLFAASAEDAVVNDDRRWQLELETIDGLKLTDPRQWTIHAVPDKAPSVTLSPIQPSGITRSARIDIQGQASDDLGLVQVDLIWQSGTDPVQHSPLWSATDPRGSSVTDPTTGASTQAPINSSSVASEKIVDISTIWQAAQQSWSVGQRIVVELEARDTSGQVSRSLPQTLEVLDTSAAIAQMKLEQSKAFGPLRQLLDAQKRNQQTLDRVNNVMQSVDSLDQSQLDALANVQQLERTIAKDLAGGQDSLLADLRDLSEKLERSALQDSEVAGEVSRMIRQIEQVQQTALEPTLNKLEQAHTSLREGLSQGSTRKDALQQTKDKTLEATQSHQHVTDRLSSLVSSVAAAESMADIQRQVQELAAQQSSVLKDTEQLQVDSVVKGNANSVTAQRSGILSDQQNLARAVEELINKLQPAESNSSHESSSDANSRRLLDDLRKQLVDGRVSDQMRQAADRLEANQLAEAMQAQNAAKNLLAQVADEFGGRNSGSLQSSTQNMQDLAKQLESLAASQHQNADKLRDAADGKLPANSAELESVLEGQRALTADIEKLNELSTTLTNSALSELLAQAEESAEAAESQSDKKQFAEASRSAHASAEQLQAASEVANQKAAQLQSQMEQQDLLDLQALVASAVKRHAPIVAALDSLASPNADSAQPAAIKEWISQEQQIRQQLQSGRQRLQSLAAFDWMFGQCHDELTRTIAALERERLHPDAWTSAQAALEMLHAAEVALASSIQPDEPADPQAADPSPEPQDNADKTNQPSNRPQMLASLKLLREMQTHLNQQAEKLLGQAVAANDPNIQRLADRQQALADQVKKLIDRE